MTLDKYTNLKKIVSAVCEKIKKKRKIFHVNVDFRCSDFNQKLAVLLLAYIALKFRHFVRRRFD